MKKTIKLVCAALFLVLLPLISYAESAAERVLTVSSADFSEVGYMTDKNERSYSSSWGPSSLTVTADGEISSLYIVFDKIPGEWTLQIGETEIKCGENGFLHEYISLPESSAGTNTVSFRFSDKTAIDEIYAFSDGKEPDFVQKWEKACDKADIMLLSSHCDDEQLFFAGVLPYYTTVRELEVQVVYLVNNFDTHERPHEMLDGLWTVGVRHYPTVAPFPDLYSESYDGAVSVYKNAGVSVDDIKSYITENIRRFKPQVIVTHDVNGEYGHGMHVLCSALTREIVVNSDKADYFPDSYLKYGGHTVKKLYLHLYPENEIYFDIDKPEESLGGLTPFEVTRQGFAKHKSQHWTWFYRWMYGEDGAPVTKAADIRSYSPCRYGLYFSSVGADTVGGDFFENLTSYAVLDAPPETETETESETESAIETESEETETETDMPNETEPRETESDGEKEDGDGKIVSALFIIIGAAFLVTTAAVLLGTAKSNADKKKRRKRRRR